MLSQEDFEAAAELCNAMQPACFSRKQWEELIASAPNAEERAIIERAYALRQGR